MVVASYLLYNNIFAVLFVVYIFIPPHALLRGEVLRVLHREMFGEGDYEKGPCCSADGVRVHKEEAAKRTAIRTAED